MAPSNKRVLNRYNEDVQAFEGIKGLKQYFMQRKPGVQDYYDAVSFDGLATDTEHVSAIRNATTDAPDGLPAPYFNGSRTQKILEIPTGTWPLSVPANLSGSEGIIPVGNDSDDQGDLMLIGQGKDRTILKAQDLNHLLYVRGGANLWLADLSLEGADNGVNYTDPSNGILMEGGGSNLFLRDVNIRWFNAAIYTRQADTRTSRSIGPDDYNAWAPNTYYNIGAVVHGIWTGPPGGDVNPSFVGPYGYKSSVNDLYRLVAGPGLSSPTTVNGRASDGPFGHSNYGTDSKYTTSTNRWQWIGYRYRRNSTTYVAGDRVRIGQRTMLCMQGGTTASSSTAAEAAAAAALATDAPFTDGSVKWLYAPSVANIFAKDCDISGRYVSVFQTQSNIPETNNSFWHGCRLHCDQDRNTDDLVVNGRPHIWYGGPSCYATFVGCEFYNAQHFAVHYFTDGGDHYIGGQLTMLGNTIHDCPQGIATSIGGKYDFLDPAGLKSNYGALIQGNTFANITGDNIRVYDGVTKIIGNRFIYSRGSDTNQPVAITDSASGVVYDNNVTIADNDFTGFQGTTAIRLYDGSTSPWKIYGNTFGNLGTTANSFNIYINSASGRSPLVEIHHNDFSATVGTAEGFFYGNANIRAWANTFRGTKNFQFYGVRGNIDVEWFDNLHFGSNDPKFTEPESNTLNVRGNPGHHFDAGGVRNYSSGIQVVLASSAPGTKLVGYMQPMHDRQAVTVAPAANQTIGLSQCADLHILSDPGGAASIQKMTFTNTDSIRLMGGTVKLLVNANVGFTTGGDVGGFAAAYAAPASTQLWQFNYDPVTNLWYRLQ